MRSLSFKRQYSKYELGSWSILFNRHRYLLTVLTILIILCTVYLYFAISFGTKHSCAGLTGPQKHSCHMELVKSELRTTQVSKNGIICVIMYYTNTMFNYLGFVIQEMYNVCKDQFLC